MFLAAKNLLSRKKLLQEWSSIDQAIKDFNASPELCDTLKDWIPSNRIGRGEAQFQMLYKTLGNVDEPDFVPAKDEGYSIKYFGHNGKGTVLSGEFLNKDQAINLDESIRSILRILNIPSRIRKSKLKIVLSGDHEADAEKLERDSKPNWSVIKLTTGISSADVQSFIDHLEAAFEKHEISGSFEDLRDVFLKKIRANVNHLKEYLLSEFDIQRGIIGLYGSNAVKIDSISQIKIVYIKTNFRIAFCYVGDDVKNTTTTLEKLLPDNI